MRISGVDGRQGAGPGGGVYALAGLGLAAAPTHSENAPEKGKATATQKYCFLGMYL